MASNLVAQKAWEEYHQALRELRALESQYEPQLEAKRKQVALLLKEAEAATRLDSNWK